MTRARLVTALAVIAVALGGVLWVVNDSDTPGTTPGDDTVMPEYDFTIPAGSGARIDAGEALEIIPAELEVTVGESIRIVNEDDRGHVVGIFYVGAGETIVQSFTSSGELSGSCSVHPSGRFTLRVLPA